MRYARFRFTHRALDGRNVRLGYALESGDGSGIAFEETLVVPEALGIVHDPSPAALLGLHLAGGMSYWKTCCPREIVLEDGALDSDDAAFFGEVWRQGLGEFFYVNRLDPGIAPRFPAGGAVRDEPTPRPDGPSLLLWGGGKDSAVSHAILAAGGEDHDLLVVGRPEWDWMRRSAEASGRTLHLVERRLDPALFELNRAGALNGHVPLNAYLAFAGILFATLAGRRAVIASNEASASEGNVTWKGIDVNHQWSKGRRFEGLVRDWQNRHGLGGSPYFSLLRPLTELRIARVFADEPLFHDVTTSCNRNFTQTGASSPRWCGRCAKCVFVYLVLRPWLDDAAMARVFGSDLLADPANVPWVEQILGVTGVKPFECVGTPEEAAAAFHLAQANGRAIGAPALAVYRDRVRPRLQDPARVADEALAWRDDHLVPEPWLGMLHAYLAAH